jgi:predicted ferric reductase
MLGDYAAASYWRPFFIGMFGPTSLAACLCALLLTTHVLPETRWSWFHALVGTIRKHRPPTASDAEYGRDLAVHKVNQFGRGEPNFNVMAHWLVVLPCTFVMVAYTVIGFGWADADGAGDPQAVYRLGIEYTSYTFGLASVWALSFFLIPVTRHSVLLAAVGWSPVHALRIHIWAGYTSFLFMLIHGGLLVPIWFTLYDYPVWQQVVPNPACWSWEWTEETADDIQPNCFHVFANWTGLLATACFIALWGTSLNWVRRTHYRLFYICHMVFGTLTILTTILHINYAALVLLPSVTYYLASTSPTLIQALASKFRGGVKVRAVRRVAGSNGCVEIQFEAHPTALADLHREPCRFVKVCVPQLSFIWHPFDVYAAPPGSSDATNNTVRFMFRPAGRFTKNLAERLSDKSQKPTPPVTFLVDGFYRGADRCQQAFQHDCVTLVAGGAAITPFLSLLPALLRQLAALSPAQATTRTVVLHWVVREPELSTFVTEQYLRPILDGPARACVAARNDVTVKVKVYVTGKAASSDGGVIKTLDEPEASAPKVAAGVGDESATLASSSRFLAPKMDDSNRRDTTNDSPDQGEDNTGGGSDARSSDVSGGNNDSNEGDAAPGGGAGHPLELARMLPRRFSRAVANFPYFAALSSSIWVGYWYIFKHDPTDPMSYYQYSQITWYTVYAILMYVAYGVGVEAIVLGLRKYWPQEAESEAASAPVVPSKSAGDDDGKGNDAEGDLQEVPAVNIEYFTERPTMDQIFEDARLADAPGVFMYGPTSLTGAVKAEAAKENSVFGLTRFCLYDEPYEM